MSKENIIKLLDKFNIKYKKYGEEQKDAISFRRLGLQEVVISAFDDECEVCTITISGSSRVLFSGWTTYQDIMNLIIEHVNSRPSEY